MKVTKLLINNFMGIGSADLALDDRGLVLIQGENLDDTSAKSNGAAKSTIAEALFWCLYGKTSRGVTGDDVVNVAAKKDCYVTSIVADDEASYEITRHRKHTIGGKRSGVIVSKIEKDGSKTDLTRGTDKLTQELIDQIMGCSEAVFTAAVYSGQEAMPDIPNMTDRELKSLIEEAANINLIERAYDIARARLNDAKREEEKAGQSVERNEEWVAYHSNRVSQEKLRIQQWEEKRQQDVTMYEARVKGAVDLAKEAAAKRDAIDLDKIKAAREKVVKAIADIDAKIDGLSGEAKERDRLQSEVSEANSALTTAKRMQDRSSADLEQFRRELERVNSRLGEPCRECGKPVTEADLSAVQEGIQKKIAAAKDTLGHDRDQVDVYVKEARAAKEALDTFVAGMTDVFALNSKRREYQEALAKLDTRIAERQTLAVEVERCKDAARSHSEGLKRERERANPHVETSKGIEKELNDAREALDQSKEALRLAEELRVDAAAVAEIFGPKGVRAHILDTVTPFLNDRTSSYLGALSDGNIEAVWTTLVENNKGELREQFAVEVSKPGMGAKFKAISGGEKRKVRLACALALQDLVASRATKPIDLWVGDEIDDALDEAGLERLMGVLEQKARERGTVLVISHNSLRDWIRDHVTVTMKGRRATVEGVLNN